MIPFFDMKARNSPRRDEFLRAIGEVIDSGSFAGGPFVAKFTGQFAAYCGTRHAVGVGSGTDALWLTLVAMGIGPGDEVITVPMTFVATVEAICRCGARPVFADIETDTYTMDPSALEAVVTPRTKAVIPVHLFGQMANMNAIREIADRHGLRVIEDAAQAHGACYESRKAGSLGDAGCFSFYPSKNLGAFGEAGAIVTDDDALAAKLRSLKNHGQSEKYHHELVGWNSRMDGIQAQVLRIKLAYLDAENEKRRSLALCYDRNLAGIPGVRTPIAADDRTHVYHVYALRVANRLVLERALNEHGIGYGIHYPVPIHLQPAYHSLGYTSGDFPVAEQCAGEFISLPMYPEMTVDQVEHISEVVRKSAGVCAAA